MQVPFVTIGSGSFWVRFWAFLGRLGRGIMVGLRYIFFFEWVTDLARWLITTGGNIAESAFLLATVYVTINTVAHQLIAWLVPDNIVVILNQVSVIAFSVLPELIIFAAIKVTFDHYKMAVGTKRLDAWVWSIAYTLPTVVFLALTIFTISSFVSVEAVTNNAPQATGVMLVVRCLAGWSYGMLQMLWDRLGHEGYSNLFTQLSDRIVDLGSKVLVRDASITTLEKEKTDLEGRVSGLVVTVAARDASLVDLQVVREQEKKQSAHDLAALQSRLQSEIEVLQFQRSEAERLLKSHTGTIATLNEEIEELKEQNGTLDSELVEAHIALARRPGSAAVGDADSEEVISEAVINSDKYQKVKVLMQQQLTSGQKINMKKISADTGISYNTVRRYAQSILNSLVDRKTA